MPLVDPPVEPVEQAARVLQVPANLQGECRLPLLRQQRVPADPGLQQAPGIRIETTQRASQRLGQCRQALGVEGFTVEGHLQIEGVLLGHMNGGRMSAGLAQGITLGKGIRLRPSEGGLGRRQCPVGGIGGKLIQMMGLGRQPVAHQRLDSLIGVQVEMLGQVAARIGTPRRRDGH